MKVYELIEALKQVDITKDVYIFNNSDITPIDYVDELSDRIDINVKEITQWHIQ